MGYIKKITFWSFRLYRYRQKDQHHVIFLIIFPKQRAVDWKLDGNIETGSLGGLWVWKPRSVYISNALGNFGQSKLGLQQKNYDFSQKSSSSKVHLIAISAEWVKQVVSKKKYEFEKSEIYHKYHQCLAILEYQNSNGRMKLVFFLLNSPPQVKRCWLKRWCKKIKWVVLESNEMGNRVL